MTQHSARAGDPPVLRAWRDPDRDVLIRVTAWLCQEPVTDQYFERQASASILWNYLRRYGPTTVLRKIRSRLAERGRNAKVAGVGRGVVLEAPEGAALRPGAQALFIATNAAQGADELVVEARLAAPLLDAARPDVEALRTAMRLLKGYAPWSGAELPSGPIEVLREAAGPPSTDLREAPAPRSVDRLEGRVTASGRPNAVIFGLGNYAKTLIIPNIRHRLKLACVHEIDPDQLAYLRGSGVALDTSPHARSGEAYDAWFIAGYHHTHADLAATALERGGYAVVEKPIATDPVQYERLRRRLAATPGGPRLFACFQKRYAAFNRHIHADLGVAPGEPVHMSALVYEVPLPRLHWYNWPNSGSRIISNACHWLDFFMWTNGYSPVVRSSARRAGLDDVHCLVELENGASLLLELTHKGSPRVGVREMIELRSEDAAIRIVDAASYASENADGVIRRLRVNPVAAYATMYRRIAEVIAEGGPGDAVESYRSTELMLALEADLLAARPGTRRTRRVA